MKYITTNEHINTCFVIPVQIMIHSTISYSLYPTTTFCAKPPGNLSYLFEVDSPSSVQITFKMIVFWYFLLQVNEWLSSLQTCFLILFYLFKAQYLCCHKNGWTIWGVTSWCLTRNWSQISLTQFYMYGSWFCILVPLLWYIWTLVLHICV